MHVRHRYRVAEKSTFNYNDYPFVGIIIDCKVIYVWPQPHDLETFVLAAGIKHDIEKLF